MSTAATAPSNGQVVSRIKAIVAEGDAALLTRRLVRTQLKAEFPALDTEDEQWKLWFNSTLNTIAAASTAAPSSTAAESSSKKRKRRDRDAAKKTKKNKKNEKTKTKKKDTSVERNGRKKETNEEDTATKAPKTKKTAPTPQEQLPPPPRYGASSSDSDDSDSESYSESESDADTHTSSKPKKATGTTKRTTTKTTSSTDSKLTVAQQFELATQNPWLASTTRRCAARSTRTPRVAKTKKAKKQNNDTEQQDDTDTESPKKKKKKANTGWAKPLVLSPRLSAFFGGEQQMSRLEIGKRLRAYFKEHQLQSPKDGRVILFDDALQEVFKRKTTTYFKLGKLISEHAKDPRYIV